ncbi:hypothetical protein P5752_22940 [Bacillus cereus]|nr:hypothetical protein [Bacillus cereus]MDF9518359.1 hypothetical protein [Bacillus cereus]MDF9569689.1 hypothetical protein [Bacillus cereus]
MEVGLCRCQCLTELVVCKNAVAAKERAGAVTAMVLACAVVAVGVGVIIAREVDVVRVVIVVENVDVVVDRVFNQQVNLKNFMKGGSLNNKLPLFMFVVVFIELFFLSACFKLSSVFGL